MESDPLVLFPLPAVLLYSLLRCWFTGQRGDELRRLRARPTR